MFILRKSLLRLSSLDGEMTGRESDKRDENHKEMVRKQIIPQCTVFIQTKGRARGGCFIACSLAA